MKHIIHHGTFTAGRRFCQHIPECIHHGISGVKQSVLSHHPTHMPTLKFLALLAKLIQTTIKEQLPQVWKETLARLGIHQPLVKQSFNL
jgi:hypothetical protein